MADKVCILWSGGKDSALAFHLAKSTGYDVKLLATFAPPEPDFKAHPLKVVRCQAEALDMPHILLTVEEPYREAYIRRIIELRDEYGIEALVSGDMAEVDGRPNWVRECSEGVGMEVVTPLWGRDRGGILKELVGLGFRAVFSCVKKQALSDDWVGSVLDDGAIHRLSELNKSEGIDICGENGEYHTIVLDGPDFRKTIRIDSFTRCTKGPLSYMDIGGLSLIDKGV